MAGLYAEYVFWMEKYFTCSLPDAWRMSSANEVKAETISDSHFWELFTRSVVNNLKGQAVPGGRPHA